MRGGTSKAVFIHEDLIPKDPRIKDEFILALFGSPDHRQIDGLGGSDITTSKCAIIAPSTRDDADVDYTFAQVGIDQAFVGYDINCGNISSAVGVYAIEEGMVEAVEPITKVRIYNTNTDKILIGYIPVRNGKPIVNGDFKIDGVPGTGAEIKLDYSRTLGAITGKLLPTGNVRDELYIPSLQKMIEVSIVDFANTAVFLRAIDIGMTGTETPKEFTPERLQLLEEIKRESAKKIGLPETGIPPFQVLVGPPADFEDLSNGVIVKAEEVDFNARMTFVGSVHKAFAGTISCCTAVAAALEGSIVNAVSTTSQGIVRIGHPSGILPITTEVTRNSEGWSVEKVMISRTARRIMNGYAYINKERLSLNENHKIEVVKQVL
jgi:2-methylaconitate cis-trans-isomerase PrpF